MGCDRPFRGRGYSRGEGKKKREREKNGEDFSRFDHSKVVLLFSSQISVTAFAQESLSFSLCLSFSLSLSLIPFPKFSLKIKFYFSSSLGGKLLSRGIPWRDYGFRSGNAVAMDWTNTHWCAYSRREAATRQSEKIQTRRRITGAFRGELPNVGTAERYSFHGNSISACALNYGLPGSLSRRKSAYGKKRYARPDPQPGIPTRWFTLACNECSLQRAHKYFVFLYCISSIPGSRSRNNESHAKPAKGVSQIYLFSASSKRPPVYLYTHFLWTATVICDVSRWPRRSLIIKCETASRVAFSPVARTDLSYARAINEIACSVKIAIIRSCHALLAIAHATLSHTYTHIRKIQLHAWVVTTQHNTRYAFELNLTRFISEIVELYDANVMRGARTKLISV